MKKSLSLVVSSLFILLSAGKAWAQDLSTEGLTDEQLRTIEDGIWSEAGSRPAGFDQPRNILTAAMPYLLTFGGLILFVMLIWGGFEMLTGAANPKSQEAGKQRITAAIIGFLLLFSSYWLAQLVQIIFGVSIIN